MPHTEETVSETRKHNFDLIGLLAKWSAIFVVGTAIIYAIGYLYTIGYLSVFHAVPIINEFPNVEYLKNTEPVIQTLGVCIAICVFLTYPVKCKYINYIAKWYVIGTVYFFTTVFIVEGYSLVNGKELRFAHFCLANSWFGELVYGLWLCLPCVLVFALQTHIPLNLGRMTWSHLNHGRAGCFLMLILSLLGRLNYALTLLVLLFGFSIANGLYGALHAHEILKSKRLPLVVTKATSGAEPQTLILLLIKDDKYYATESELMLSYLTDDKITFEVLSINSKWPLI